jgi:hypothetical protein
MKVTPYCPRIINFRSRTRNQATGFKGPVNSDNGCWQKLVHCHSKEDSESRICVRASELRDKWVKCTPFGSDHRAEQIIKKKKRPFALLLAHSISPLAHLIALHKCYSAYALVLLLNYAVRSANLDARLCKYTEGDARSLTCFERLRLTRSVPISSNEWAPCRTCGSQAWVFSDCD